MITNTKYYLILYVLHGLPWWLSSLRIYLPMQEMRVQLWVGKITWKGKLQSTPVFLPGKLHGQRGPWGRRVGHDLATKQQQTQNMISFYMYSIGNYNLISRDKVLTKLYFRCDHINPVPNLRTTYFGFLLLWVVWRLSRVVYWYVNRRLGAKFFYIQ